MDGEGPSQAIKSELSIFDDHVFQVSQLKHQWMKISPRNIYQGYDGTNIELAIPEADGWYIDFNDSYLVVYATIIKTDDSGNRVKLGADDDVAFVNFAGAALFKDVKLWGGV